METIEDRTRLIQGNIQLYVLLLFKILCFGAYVFFFYDPSEKLSDQQPTKQMEIKNPEAGTSR